MRGGRGLLPELVIGALLAVCCALPLLLTSGAIATFVAFVMRRWVMAGLAGGVLLVTVAAWWRRRRRRRVQHDGRRGV